MFERVKKLFQATDMTVGEPWKYIAMAVTQSLSGVMRGAGDTMTPMWISLVTTVFYLRGKWKKIAFSEPIMEK